MFTFIYLKRTLDLLNFWGQVFSVLAFAFLFVGSGYQVCEQKVLLRGVKANMRKSVLAGAWRFGVFFYTLALPLSLSANLFFWLTSFFSLQDDLARSTMIHYQMRL